MLNAEHFAKLLKHGPWPMAHQAHTHTLARAICTEHLLIQKQGRLRKFEQTFTREHIRILVEINAHFSHGILAKPTEEYRQTMWKHIQHKQHIGPYITLKYGPVFLFRDISPGILYTHPQSQPPHLFVIILL